MGDACGKGPFGDQWLAAVPNPCPSFAAAKIDILYERRQWPPRREPHFRLHPLHLESSLFLVITFVLCVACMNCLFLV